MEFTNKTKWLIALIIIVVFIVLIILYLIFRDTPVRLDTKKADIVIIGAGTSGCILARRLSEKHPQLRIVVLERGINRRDDQNVFNLKNMVIAGYSKPYSEVLPTDFSSSLVASTALMYGGCSSHNFGLAVRGSPNYYNGIWKERLGLDYNATLKYMHRMEAFHPEYSPDNNNKTIPLNSTRSTNGLIQITPLPTKLLLGPRILPAIEMGLEQGPGIFGKAFLVITNTGPLRASNALSDNINTIISKTRNVNIVEDYNADQVACVASSSQLFIDSIVGIRQSTDVKYLPREYIHIHTQSRAVTISKNGRQAASLQIVPNAMVNRIVDNGVEYVDQNGNKQVVNTNRTIVCAGGIYTPYLLSKSGFGDTLCQNLRTHYGFSAIIAVESDSSESFTFSNGPLAFVSRSGNDNAREWQVIISGSASIDLINSVGGVSGITSSTKTFSIILWNLNPRTRGNIGADGDKPTVNLRLYEDGGIDDPKSDISNMIDGLDWIATSVIPELKKKYNTMRLVFPPQSVIDGGKKNEWVPYIKQGVSLTDHYCNTSGDAVDTDTFLLRNNTNNNKVHVVDASVLPLPDGNTNYPIMVMAEIAAERISKLL